MDHRPAGFRTITPGMSAKGAAQIIEFMRQAFGAVPGDTTLAPDGTIAHGVVQIGDSVLEISEARPEWPARRSTIHLYSADADRLYERALAAGARMLSAPEDASYGDRAAAVEDPAGNHWYLATRLTGGPVPAGFHTLTPYVIARRATALITFMREAFGASEHGIFLREDGSVVHAQLQIGDSMIELADGAGPWQPIPCALHLYVADPDETFARAVRAGASGLYEPRDMPYGDREGGVQDVSGNHWYIARHGLGSGPR